MPGAKGTTAKDISTVTHDDRRGEDEDRLVGEGRDPVLLGEDLDHVGDDLQQAERARRGSGRSGPARAPAAGARARSARRRPSAAPTRTPTTMTSGQMTSFMALTVLRRRESVRPRRQARRPAGRAARPAAPAIPRGSAADEPDGQRVRVQPPTASSTSSPFRSPSAAASVGVQAEVGLRAPARRCPGDSDAQLLRAEDVVHRHEQPLAGARRERAAGRRREVRRLPSPAPARSAAGRGRRRAAGRRPRSWNLFSAWTEFQPGAQKRGMSAAGGCPGSPPWRRRAANRGRRAACGSWTSDVGVHGRAAAVAVRLARDLLPGDAEVGRRRGLARPARRRAAPPPARRATSSSVCHAAASGASGGAHRRRAASASSPGPSPAGAKTWKKRCARPSLFTQRAVALGEGGGGQHDVGLARWSRWPGGR